MIISKKQIFYLIEATKTYRDECVRANHPDSIELSDALTKLLKDILEQQSEELRVIECPKL